MTLKIDKAGRIVVPKPLRQRLGLRAGMDLEVGESSQGLLLKPVNQCPSLVREGRFLIHTGRLPGAYGALTAIEVDREERTQKLAGL